MTQKPGRLGVGIVGAGRVGAVLGSALRAAGHAVVAVSGTSEASKDRAEALLPHVPVLPVDEVVQRSELVILAVPDDALPDLVAGLAALNHFTSGQLVVHTAAGSATAVLQPATPWGPVPRPTHRPRPFPGPPIARSGRVAPPFPFTPPHPGLP